MHLPFGRGGTRRPWRRDARRVRFVLALAGAVALPVLLAAGGAGRALQEKTAAKAQAPLDPVVREVARMLGAKVSEPVIVRWLEAPEHHPTAVGSGEVIELKRVGASDGLIEKLLDLAGKGSASQAAGSSSPTSAAAGGGATTPAAGASGALAAVAAPAAPGGPVAALHWTIAYSPNFAEDDEAWDLYIYLDGRYLVWVKAPLVSFMGRPREFDHAVSPGHHVLRLIEERHERKPDGSGWSNEARVAPTALAFDLASATAGKVEIRCEVRRHGGPISIRLTQGDRQVLKTQPRIGQPETWPALCEEVTPNDTSGKDPTWSSQRALARCLHWPDLWPGLPPPPTRDAVRADLERQSYHPGPAGSGD
jgi:hypothetical protein